MKKWKRTTRARKRDRRLSTQAREVRARKEKVNRAVDSNHAEEFRTWTKKKEAAYQAWRKTVTEGKREAEACPPELVGASV